MITLKEYEARHNLKFPLQQIKVIYRKNKYIYFNTKFGLCKKQATSFGESSFNLKSAVNKTNFFINYSNEIHNFKYDYSDVILKNDKKVKIKCKIHNNEFTQSPANHLSGRGCPKCGKRNLRKSRLLTTKSFIEKAIKIHGNKYDYSKVNYTKINNKIIITCPKHGDFIQSPSNHLSGYNCKKCGRDEISKSLIKNPPGWTLTNWIRTAEKSKNFDSFKVYIIVCWDNYEKFYKIGRTFKLIKNRFSGVKMPYQYRIIKIFNGKPEYIFNLENDLKKMNKKNKYIPKNKFAGMYECFKQINYDRK